jgi:drug/metabolite transporter (DMT)-like permease
MGPEDWLVLLATGVFPTFLAYLAYTEGLRRTPASLATLLAATEPVVAVVLGAVVADERLSVHQFGGIVLVLSAAVVAAAPLRKADRTAASIATSVREKP